MKVTLKLFFKWGISFGKPYSVEEHGNRAVSYASKDALIDEICKKYHPDKLREIDSTNEEGGTIPVNAVNIGQAKKADTRPQARLRTEKPHSISEVHSGTT